MSSRLAVARRRFRRWLSPQQQRGVQVLAWASVVSLAGVSITGLWQFVAHESDPGWYGHVPGNGQRLQASPSSGVAEWHGIFATAVGAVVLFGGAWLAYRVVHDIPWPALVVFVVVVFGLITGSVIRFNLVKLRGRTYEDADRGYVQLFGGDLEFVVTDRWELGATAIRLWTIAHVVTVPVLLAVVWLGLPRRDDAES